MWLEQCLSVREMFGQTQPSQHVTSVAFPSEKPSPFTCEDMEACGSPCMKSPISLTMVPLNWGLIQTESKQPEARAILQGHIPREHPTGKNDQANPHLSSGWPRAMWASVCHTTAVCKIACPQRNFLSSFAI